MLAIPPAESFCQPQASIFIDYLFVIARFWSNQSGIHQMNWRNELRYINTSYIIKSRLYITKHMEENESILFDWKAYTKDTWCSIKCYVLWREWKNIRCCQSLKRERKRYAQWSMFKEGSCSVVEGISHHTFVDSNRIFKRRTNKVNNGL